MPRPNLPQDVGVNVRIEDPPSGRENVNRAELATRRAQREQFVRAFERFREKAELSGAQTRAVLLVLYDFQETQRTANEQHRWARAWFEYATDELDRLHKDADRVFFAEVDYADARLTGILSERQYSVWLDEMLPVFPYQLLDDYAPLTAASEND